MNINTNTGNITLTKTEQKLLGNAKSLLLKIGKHGDGKLAESSDSAAENLGDVIKELNKVEEPVAV